MISGTVDDRVFRAMLRKYAAEAPSVLLAGLMVEGYRLEQKSMDQVPVDTSQLRESRLTAPVSEDPPQVAVSYGKEYAAAVHERLDVPHEPPTKAKFLEDPLNDLRVGFFKRLAEWVRDHL